MPLVVMDVDTSINIGKSFVGQPAAMGFGVSVPVRPPKGATDLFSGAEDMMIATILF